VCVCVCVCARALEREDRTVFNIDGIVFPSAVFPVCRTMRNVKFNEDL